MKIDELLKENKVTLFVFHSQQWERDGFYFPDLRTIYVSAALSNADRERVILHELGHTEGLDHCPDQSCLMRDAEGGNPLDQEKNFCLKCRNFLIRKGWKLKP